MGGQGRRSLPSLPGHCTGRLLRETRPQGLHRQAWDAGDPDLGRVHQPPQLFSNRHHGRDHRSTQLRLTRFPTCSGRAAPYRSFKRCMTSRHLPIRATRFTTSASTSCSTTMGPTFSLSWADPERRMPGPSTQTPPTPILATLPTRMLVAALIRWAAATEHAVARAVALAVAPCSCSWRQRSGGAARVVCDGGRIEHSNFSAVNRPISDRILGGEFLRGGASGTRSSCS